MLERAVRRLGRALCGAGRAESFIGLDGHHWECHSLFMGDTSLLAVGPKGRVVIPVEIRRQLGLEEGSQLVAMVEGDGVLLLPRGAVKRRLRGMFAGVGASMADELIRDRRAAAAEESSEE
jgi:AbrB family looped-hinge helix DNA binding protein